MFDVHYHLVFGVDDGPKCIEDSLALIEASIDEGVTHIVATPHANHKYPLQPEINRERLDILRERLGGRITLGLGCDFHMSFDNLQSLHEHPERYTVNGKQYLLVEFPDFAIPHTTSESLYRIRSAGIIPIITHPERNPILIADPERLKPWIETDCLVQITASSLCGNFGPKSRSIAMKLLRNNQVHLVASDAHSVKWRPPSMRRAYDVLLREFGKQTADRLCIDNPRSVFLGECLPLQQEIAGSYAGARTQKRGFLGKLFGK